MAFNLILKFRKNIVLHEFEYEDDRDINLQEFIVSIEYQHEYQVVGSSYFRSIFVNKNGQISERFKNNIFINRIINSNNNMRTTVNDLSRDTKALNIKQLNILNSHRKQSLFSKD